MEDLLRLCAVLPPKEAIRAWEQKKGDKGRQYALGREFEMLSNAARELLVAACYKNGASTTLELQSVTGMSDDAMTEGLLHLQRLFLIPKPSLIEGEQRYNVNINTRVLVRRVYGNTELWRRVEAAHKAIAGEIPRSTNRTEIGALIRKAMLFARNNQGDEAEKVLVSGLEKFPNDPDLTSFLGGVYKAYEPPRITDAREKYHRAWQLRCANENSYRHWAQMELEAHEWAKAYDAAEKGMQILGKTKRLLYLSGYARGRFARELVGRTQQADASTQLALGYEALKSALTSRLELKEWDDRNLNDDIYRALVFNCEARNDIAGMTEYFERWLREHPDSPLPSLIGYACRPSTISIRGGRRRALQSASGSQTNRCRPYPRPRFEGQKAP
jgi:tetratricopeptide (TPR) repeat protein